jgi:hypothetical protein
MSPPERHGGLLHRSRGTAASSGPPRFDRSRGTPASGGPPRFGQPRQGRWIGALAIVILILITINTIVTPSKGLAGVAPGRPLPPFAAPLATGDLQGSVNVATHPGEGLAKRAACTVRGPRILNICQLYEQGPVVLALFVDASACDGVLGEMQALVRAGGRRFSGVRFAAVAIKGERASLRALVRSRGLTFPVGVDVEGVLPGLYAMASCPQITFAYPGGIVQSKALLTTPSPAVLRRRVSELVAAALARGWRSPP